MMLSWWKIISVWYVFVFFIFFLLNCFVFVFFVKFCSVFLLILFLFVFLGLIKNGYLLKNVFDVHEMLQIIIQVEYVKLHLGRNQVLKHFLFNLLNMFFLGNYPLIWIFISPLFSSSCKLDLFCHFFRVLGYRFYHFQYGFLVCNNLHLIYLHFRKLVDGLLFWRRSFHQFLHKTRNFLFQVIDYQFIFYLLVKTFLRFHLLWEWLYHLWLFVLEVYLKIIIFALVWNRFYSFLQKISFFLRLLIFHSLNTLLQSYQQLLWKLHLGIFA